jgi:MerR family copper efflux transcriptional regulator
VSSEPTSALDLHVRLRVYVLRVTAGLRIADVARRSGFSAATLRYYEEIGLLPVIPRTDGGYRAYDDRTLERLAFIARAKQLGCTLEEIADLTIAWDGGECGPVQDGLRRLVADKLALAQNEIVALTTLTAELQTAAAALERHRPVGPCDDACGCVAAEADAAATISVALTAKPHQDAEVPIACTLGPDGLKDRMVEWESLLGDTRALLGSAVTRTAFLGGVRLEFGPEGDVHEIARLSVAEQDCCRFFSFAITVDRRGIGLEVTAPDDALPIVHSLFGAPA